MFRTLGIIITYHPDEFLIKTCESLSLQVEGLILVDNSEMHSRVLECIQDRRKEFHIIDFIKMGKNAGLAAAQNVGVKKALEIGADSVILSDQDTFFPPGAVESLRQCLKDPRVAACGPRIFEINSGTILPFIRRTWNFSPFFPTSGCHEVLQLINSGMLLKCTAWKEIGPYDSSLFLDWADLEWCWRAWKKGYRILGNADVTIIHRLGDKALKVRGRPLWQRSPQRVYYIVRNALFLGLRSPYLNAGQRLFICGKTLAYLFVYPLFFNPRRNMLKSCFQGLWDGIRGRMGRCLRANISGKKFDSNDSP